jgi:hypothetical protein
MWPASIRDISPKGLGLVLHRRFERGAGLAVELPGPDGKPVDTLLTRVMHITALSGGRWLLGCAFVSELSDDELGSLLRRAGALPAVSPGAVGTNVVVPDLAFEGTGNSGRVANVSVRRLFLSGEWPPPPGTLLKVKVANQPAELPGVLIRVNDCVLRDGRWTLNYTFITRPGADLMGVFGYTPSLMDF